MGVVNRMAQKRYATFWNSLMAVNSALEYAGSIAHQVDDKRAAATPFTATSDEVKRAVNRAVVSLAVVSKMAKQFEAELVSQDWRE